MKLEQQVCSLELAKKLKELGVKQESLFWWHEQIFPTLQKIDGTEKPTPNKTSSAFVSSIISDTPDGGYRYSAFTVAELGDMLPDVVFYEQGAEPLDYGKSEQGWWCSYKSHTEQAETEADARARMIIYLIKNNLYEPNN